MNDLLSSIFVFVYFYRFLPAVPDPPRMHADPANIRVAVDVLKNAKKPLVIVGKGKILLHTSY